MYFGQKRYNKQEHYLDISCSQEHEVCHCGNLPPFHKNDLRGHMQWDYNWHIHSPVSLKEIKIQTKDKFTVKYEHMTDKR